MKKSVVKSVSMAFFVSALLASQSSHAAIGQIYEVPAAWKLEDYVGGAVVVWYTSATCPDGKLNLYSPTSTDEVNRFFALVLAAKISGKMVFVRYDTVSCNIDSFGMHG